MPKTKPIYMHKETGNIKFVNSHREGAQLGSEWSQIEFTKNEKGEEIMRFRFDEFTVDIQPNGEREVVSHGNGSTD